MFPPPAHGGAFERLPASLGRALPPLLEASPPPPEPRKLSAGASLPAEVLDMVLEYLDVKYHRGTFLALLRVSPAIWEPTARVLYRNIDLGAAQVRQLFRSPISARTRLALSFVKFLVLTDVGYAAMQSLYAAARPNEPLFPSVTKVQVISTLGFLHPKPKPSPGYFPPAGIFLFGAVDMCVWNAQYLGVLRGLAAQETLSLSIHANKREQAEYALVNLLAQWNVKWNDCSVVDWYILHSVDDADTYDSLEVSVPSGIRVRCVLPPYARYLTPQGPFDPIQPPKTIQFRRPSDHYRCTVCGAANIMDQIEGRTFGGETFTVATKEPVPEGPLASILARRPLWED